MKITYRKHYAIELNWGEICLMWYGAYAHKAISALNEGNVYLAREFATLARKDWKSYQEYKKGRVI